MSKRKHRNRSRGFTVLNAPTRQKSYTDNVLTTINGLLNKNKQALNEGCVITKNQKMLEKLYSYVERTQ